jgi:hypothetical protein
LEFDEGKNVWNNAEVLDERTEDGVVIHKVSQENGTFGTFSEWMYLGDGSAHENYESPVWRWSRRGEV